MPYEIRVRSGFEAAHHLTSYNGAPEPVHGHSWVVEACVGCEELNAEGYGVDFLELEKRLKGLCGQFHHRDINSVRPFDTLSPTTENLARWFCERLAAGLPEADIRSIEVWEAPGCSVTYRP